MTELEQKLSKTWAEVVKLKNKHRCAYCRTHTSYLNAHHIFSKKNQATRWDPKNGIALCSRHHTLSAQFSAHQTPKRFREWIKTERGEEWYNNLRQKARSVKLWEYHEKEVLYSNLKKMKKSLES